jgi:hypothetical protein
VAGLSRSTSRDGALLLRRAVDDGYEQGWSVGRRDMSAHQSFSVRSGPLYRSALLGYSAGSVPSSDYQYYFREGYDRGYQDGFYQRNQYGTVSAGRATILGTVLGTILGFTIH